MNRTLAALLVTFLLGAAVGLGMGHHYWKPVQAPAEPPAPAQRQQDGSLVLERAPAAKRPPLPALPRGAVVERQVEVTVIPKEPAHVPTDVPEPVYVPTPVRVDLTLVRMPDQTQRVIATSPDGMVVGGVDIPVRAQESPRVLKWSAGAIYGANARGLFVDRDFSFVRLGVDVTRTTYDSRQGWDARVRLGLRW